MEVTKQLRAKLGPSWETTLVGMVALIVVGGMVWLGLAYANDKLLTAGVALMPIVLGALGFVSRSEPQHRRDRKRGST